MTEDAPDKFTYEDRMLLLTDIDQLCNDLAQDLIHNHPFSLAGDYTKQLLWTIGPAIRMLVWGLENTQNLAAMNGLRTLLENWANANYVFRSGGKGRDHYLTKMGEAAEHYRNALHELRTDPSLGLDHLKQAPRWTGSGLEARVAKLGEGPLFQYEYLSRYVHADVWATLNEFDTQDKEYMRQILLTWGIEFVNHTLWLIHEEKLTGDKFGARAESLNDQVTRMLAVDTTQN